MKQKAKRGASLLLALALAVGLFPMVVQPSFAAFDGSYWVGDVNANGGVDEEDLTILSNYVKDWDGAISQMKNVAAADIDGNGQVTNRDVTLLARAVAVWTDPEDYAAKYIKEVGKLTIITQPMDTEILDNSATLAIEVSGYFATVTYQWQKQAGGIWRNVASLNSDNVTYTTVGPALNISDKTGTGSEACGTYRCVVTALRGDGTLAGSVTSDTADVDPTPEPLKVTQSELWMTGTAVRYYFYHTSSLLPLKHDEENGIYIQNETQARVIKNYPTQARYQEAITPRKVERLGPTSDDVRVLNDGGKWWDSRIGYKDENGDWWIADAYKDGAYTEVAAVTGGKGPYTYTWYLSSTKDGNDVREELVEGVNCLGQGTNHILVWSDQVGKGQTEPYFLGFLFCKVTDKMGRVAKSCCYEYNAYYDNRFFHAHRMLFALNENHGWWKEGVDTSSGNSESWWTYPDNNGIFNYFSPCYLTLLIPRKPL